MIEIQFNWIYVAVVGAVILLVVGSIIMNIQKNAKDKLEYGAINYFDNIFTSMQASENTEHSVVLPGMEIEIDTPEREADVENCNYYRIKGSSMQGKSIEYVPIFSPSIVQKKILSFALGWDSPFRANYFLFMTSPDIAYVIVGEQGKLMEDLPNHLTKKTVDDMSTFREQKYYGIKYILFNQEPGKVSSGVAKLKDSQVSAIKVMPTAGIYDGGQITFYKKKGSAFVEEKTMYYVDKATLFAAIYSQTAYSYGCNIMKAVKRVNKVSGILKTRAFVIKNSGLLPMCQTSDYDRAYSLLDNLERGTASGSFAMNNLLGSIRELNTLNTEINKRSCPTIY
jgi:hypothetical protein